MKVAARLKPSHLLNDPILSYPLKCPHLHTSSQLHNRPLGRVFVKVSSAPPVMKLTFRCLSQLWYWMTQLWQWILPLLTSILQVILIGLPTSTKRPVSLGHPTTFPTVLPSVVKVRWYPDCLLEFHPKMKPQKSPNQWFPLYTAFTVY